jgi:outer membrane protein OmpA-like peptidoglycan-associated protein
LLENIANYLNKNKLMNLFDTLNEALTDEVVSKIAKLSEEEPEKTRKALDGIFYTLIAGLIRRTGSMMSVSMLYNQIQKGNQGGEMIGDMMSYLNKKDKLDHIQKVGDGLISQIFPAYKSPLVSMIGTYAGIKKNSSTMYSSLAAPMLIDAVSKEIDTSKLDVDGLITYLSDHHKPLFKLVPEELLEKMIPQLGLQELLSPKFVTAKKMESSKLVPFKGKNTVSTDETPDSTTKKMASRKLVTFKGKTVVSTDETSVSTTKSATVLATNENEKEEEVVETTVSPIPMKLLVIGLIGVLAIAGGIYWYMNFYNPSQSQSTDEESIIDSTAIQPDTITKAIIDSVAIKDSLKISTATSTPTLAEQNSAFAESLDAYLTDKAKPVGKVFPITNLAFIKGSQALDTDSDLIIKQLADLMNKYPKMQVQLQGHSTNAVGMDNKTMATKRAFAIKKRLMVKGIVEKRIDAIGVNGASNGADFKVVSK